MFKGIRQFFRNTSGNTALIFALGAVPLFLAAGSAIDYSRASQTQSVLQSATDAAAIAALSQDKMTNAKAEELVLAYLKANGADESIARGLSVDVKYDNDEGKVSVEVRGNVQTSMMRLAGYDQMDVRGFSEVLAGSAALDMVLVLDNTASMGREGRIDDLKAAAAELVDSIFKNTSSRNDIKIGIVPFSQYVNVGTANRHKSWLDVKADIADTGEKWCRKELKAGVDVSSCPIVSGTWDNDGVPVSYEYPKCGDDQYETVCSPASETWNGCVGSRPGNLDTRIDSLLTRYPGLMNTWCSNPITPLSDDKSDIKNQLSAMNPTGLTYIPAGLLWGWNLLDSNEPFVVENSSKAVPKKVMLLMTDGANTMRPSAPHHVKSDEPSDADLRTDTLCENIKAAGITVYTVAFKVEEQSAINMLEKCASESANAFDAKNKSALIESFKVIARSVANVHVAK